MQISEILNEIVCPMGKEKLIVEGEFLVCSKCGVKYPVIDGIPVLLIDEAVLPEGLSSHVELECIKK